MDLMEYQAKELFAKHGVTATLGKVVETADEARAAAEEIGGVTVDQGAGQGRWPRQGRWRQGRQDARRGLRARRGDPRADHQGPARQPGARHARRPRRWRSTTSPSCWTAPTAPTCASPRSRAVSRSRRSPRPTPTPSRRSPIDAGTGVDEAKATAIVEEAGFPAELRDQAIAMVQQLWEVFVEEDATLVEVNPLARLEGDGLEALDGKVSLDENAEFRHEDHAAVRGQGGGRPAGGQGQGQGPQLRQARRFRRHHRQRCGSGHVDPRRRRVRR